MHGGTRVPEGALKGGMKEILGATRGIRNGVWCCQGCLEALEVALKGARRSS